MSIKRSIVIGEKDTATGKKEERRLEGKVSVTAKEIGRAHV